MLKATKETILFILVSARCLSLIGGDQVHPRRLLSRAASVVLHAVENDIVSIDKSCVDSAGRTCHPRSTWSK